VSPRASRSSLPLSTAANWRLELLQALARAVADRHLRREIAVTRHGPQIDIARQHDVAAGFGGAQIGREQHRTGRDFTVTARSGRNRDRHRPAAPAARCLLLFESIAKRHQPRGLRRFELIGKQVCPALERACLPQRLGVLSACRA